MNFFLECLGLRRKKNPTSITPSAVQNQSQPPKATGDSVQNSTALPDNPDKTKFKWKFIDAQAFIYQGTLKIVEVEDFNNLDFVAISYTWSRNMLKWREWILSLGPDGKASHVPSGLEASEDMEQFHLFFTVVSFLVIVQGKSLFWMDVLSIDQDSRAEKEFFVPKMGLLYAGAAITHVYLTGSAFVTIASDEFYSPVWETRAWTLQEYILSRDVVYCYCFKDDVITEIKTLKDDGSTSRSPSKLIELNTPTLDRYSASIADSAFVLEKGDTKVTCTLQKEWMGLVTASYLSQKGIGSQINQVVGRTTMGKVLLGMRQETSKMKVISTSMTLLGGRKSTQPEDMAYSVLGILEMEDFKPRYEIGFEEARLELFEAMKPDILAIVLGTDWGCLQDTKNNDSALPRVMGSRPTIGIERMRITNSAKYTRNGGTAITSRKEKFRLWKDLSRRQSSSTAVVRATLGSSGTSRLMVMFCASLGDSPGYANIPTVDIPKEDIRPVIVSGDLRMSDDDYFNREVEYDKEIELVELAVCTHHALFPDIGDEKYMRRTALLALQCEESSGRFVNRGTVLVLDASAFSGPLSVHTIH